MLPFHHVTFSILATFQASAPAPQTVKLNDPLPEPVVGSVEFMRVGSDRCIYYASQDTFDRELYSVPFDGSGPPVKLNGPLNGSRIGRYPVLSADGSRVAFLAGGFSFAAINAVPADGSSPAIALDSFEVEDINNFPLELSPDGAWVVYRQTETSFDLSSARTDGSQPPIVLS